MSSSERQREIIANAYRHLRESLPGFVPRKQQQQMVQRVSGLLSQNTRGLIEAPTGTGKSIGYLIPGIVNAIEQDKVLVISTATASLQDQLASKDLPVALKALAGAGIEGVEWAVAKGRERHLCPIKLEGLTNTPDLFKQGEKPLLDQIAEFWEGGSWDGVRDTLPIRVDRQAWAQVANTSSSCSGEACPHYEGCPYYDAVAKAKGARVIITNHDYLLAIFANVEKSYLCDTERNLYIFDEAHHLPDKILSAFASSLDLAADRHDDLQSVARLLGSRSSASMEIAIERMTGMWKAAAHSTLAMLGDGNQHRFTLGEAPASYINLLSDLQGAIRSLIDVLDDATASAQAHVKASGTRRSAMAAIMQSRVGQVRGDLEGAIDTLDDFIEPSDDRARWLAKGRKSIEIRSSPFDSGAKARKHLWPRIACCVLTSATLTTLGDFDATRVQLGLPADTTGLRLDSPLDYSNARLVVPPLAADAGSMPYPAMVRAFVREHAVNSAEIGVLVYFTSRTQMQDVYSILSPEERGRVLMQGEWQPSAMITEHKRRVDNGEHSVMFGLDSLSEGVDLPGKYCTRVFVTRLPFPSPSDPVLATHAEHLQRKGLHAFNLLMLPKAGLKLAQVCGRLIRKDGDYGAVVCLDNRLVSKAYGRRLVASTGFPGISKR
ncbi:MAG: hypothetical protein EPN64_13235 [Burkholderiaceae bacterium]|nr:MAG: hypothetical protein EPN64_13235 [Burkholderiaceae bacterium]